MSRSELHNWECAIEALCGDNADKMLAIAQDIYNTAFVRGKNYMSSEQSELEQTRWRPVTEELPDFYQDILLSLRSLDVTDGFRSGTEPYFYCHGAYIEPQNVLAWMPRPQPYKAERSDKDEKRKSNNVE